VKRFAGIVPGMLRSRCIVTLAAMMKITDHEDAAMRRSERRRAVEVAIDTSRGRRRY